MLEIFGVSNSSNLIGVQGIYGIVNIKCDSEFCIYGKPYVGQAIAKPHAKKHKMGIGARLRDHRWHLRNNLHKNNKLQNAWNKYGEDGFRFILIEEVDEKDKVTEREQFWIDEWRSYSDGYNLKPRAESSLGLFTRTPLTDDDIAKWIVSYKDDNGKYPINSSGKVEYADSNEPLTWRAVDQIFRCGFRGVAGDRTLAQFIAKRFEKINHTNQKRYDLELLKNWIVDFHIKHGHYPNQRSGKVEGTNEKYGNPTWSSINRCLKKGHRGVPRGMSLKQLNERVKG